MGRELRGHVLEGPATGPVTADVASDHVVFRGAWRGEVGFRDIAATAGGGKLALRFHGMLVELDAGMQAARVLERMRDSPSLHGKLGLRAGTAFATAGEVDAVFVEEARGLGATEAAPEAADLVLLGVAARDGLSDVERLARNVEGRRALWVVYPKGGKPVREADVLAAGRAAGLKDVKIVRFGATHTALKFVR